MSEIIINGNILIAKYMGATECELSVKSIGIVKAYQCEEYKLPVDELEYNSSWDWLMPVLNKISNEVEISDKYEEAYSSFYHIDSNLIWLPIQDVFESVVTILKWHSEKYGWS